MAEQLTENSADVDSYRSDADIGQDGDKRCRMQVQHPPLTLCRSKIGFGC